MKRLLCLIGVVGATLAVWGSAVAQEETGQPGMPTVAEASFDPSQPETGNKLKLRLKLNAAVRAEVKWSINGEEVERSDYDGQGEYVTLGKPIKADDRISVSVIPYNASAAPGAEVSRKVVCQNAPPLLRVASQNLVGDDYTAKIEVRDPENDPVTLSLQGPPGMQIDQKGTISWKIDRTTTGSFPIVVTGRDDKGGQGVLTYSIGIRR